MADPKPIRFLLAAVLDRAVEDVRSGKPDLAGPAVAWIEADGDGDRLFTLRDVCEVLDLNVRAVRAAVLNGAGRRR